MPNAIRFHQSGGPEVLVWEPVPIGKPGPGEARVRHAAVGVNFVDIYIDAKEFGGDVRTTGRRVSWLEDISKAGKCRKGSRVP